MNTARRSPGGRIAFALALAALAGSVDALAFAELGNLFVSFMSGNSTRLGVAIAGVDWRMVAPVAGTVALFVAGAFVGSILAETPGRWSLPIVLAAEAVVTGGAAAIILATGDIAPLYAVALAMGMQNAVHPTLAGAAVGKSFVTGTLFDVGKFLAAARHDRRALWASLAALSSWAAFVAGVVSGTVLLHRMGTAATLGLVTLVLAGLAAGFAISAGMRRNLDAPRAHA